MNVGNYIRNLQEFSFEPRAVGIRRTDISHATYIKAKTPLPHRTSRYYCSGGALALTCETLRCLCSHTLTHSCARRPSYQGLLSCTLSLQNAFVVHRMPQSTISVSPGFRSCAVGFRKATRHLNYCWLYGPAERASVILNTMTSMQCVGVNVAPRSTKQSHEVLILVSHGVLSR